MSWKEEWMHNITNVTDLSKRLPMKADELERLGAIALQYPMSIPNYYLDLIDPNDPNDPIRKMCVPSLAEENAAGMVDTSGELQNTKVKGLQHKYRQTALVLSTNQCVMYCRHCFRKRLVGMSDSETAELVGPILAYIEAHPEINNVLISGGDAFLNSNEVIERYLDGLCKIDHIHMIRFGTRIPVVFPQRILEDEKLLALLREYGQKKRIYVTTQFNHPRELTVQAKQAIDALIGCGVLVSNQTVLLRGVNDDPAMLAELMDALTMADVIPYYVFQCRPVTHVKTQFQIPLEEGYQIVEDAKAQCNGYGKRFRFAMSHVSGKIEILGRMEDGRMLFKYHQAKDPADQGRIFTKKLAPGQCWLD